MGTTLRRAPKTLFVAAVLSLSATPAGAQPVTILHTFFGGTTDGQNPSASLIQSGSTLFGTTFSGGTGGDGIVFSINTDGSGFALMHSFLDGPADGRNPSGSLLQIGSTLYGTTAAGGSSFSGTVFKIGADGPGFGLLHSMAGSPNDGTGPLGGLAQTGSTFYATTNAGGTANLGTIFKININGTSYGMVHSFVGGLADGSHPILGTLAQSGSMLYGMTSVGGTASLGTIYAVRVDGTAFGLLHSFMGNPGDGEIPEGSLILSGSTLYGMTTNGGTYGSGTIFKINTDGTNYSIMHSFADSTSDGGSPTGSLILSGSQLYGMTSVGGSDSLGTIFGIGTDGSNYTTFHSFTGGPNDGAGPSGDLLLSGSTFYGVTEQGGSSNDGVVFSFVPVPEPSSLALLGTSAVVGFWRRRRFRALSV